MSCIGSVLLNTPHNFHTEPLLKNVQKLFCDVGDVGDEGGDGGDESGNGGDESGDIGEKVNTSISTFISTLMTTFNKSV